VQWPISNLGVIWFWISPSDTRRLKVLQMLVACEPRIHATDRKWADAARADRGTGERNLAKWKVTGVGEFEGRPYWTADNPHGYSAEHLQHLDRKTLIKVMRTWFYQNFEDPADKPPTRAPKGIPMDMGWTVRRLGCPYVGVRRPHA